MSSGLGLLSTSCKATFNVPSMWLYTTKASVYPFVFPSVYPCIPPVYPYTPLYTRVYLCIPLHTLVYSCIPLYTHVYPCIPLYTLLYPRIPLHTLVYPYITLYTRGRTNYLIDLRLNRRLTFVFVGRFSSCATNWASGSNFIREQIVISRVFATTIIEQVTSTLGGIITFSSTKRQAGLFIPEQKMFLKKT